MSGERTRIPPHRITPAPGAVDVEDRLDLSEQTPPGRQTVELTVEVPESLLKGLQQTVDRLDARVEQLTDEVSELRVQRTVDAASSTERATVVVGGTEFEVITRSIFRVKR